MERVKGWKTVTGVVLSIAVALLEVYGIVPDGNLVNTVQVLAGGLAGHRAQDKLSSIEKKNK